MTEHYDVIVIGSAFRGSVAAMRLTEKGYHVGGLEAGGRGDTSLPLASPPTPRPLRRLGLKA